MAEVRHAEPRFLEQQANHVMTGALTFFLSGPERIKRLSPGICDADSYSEIRLVLLRMVRNLFAPRS